jgi:hypothetical protein
LALQESKKPIRLNNFLRLYTLILALVLVFFLSPGLLKMNSKIILSLFLVNVLALLSAVLFIQTRWLRATSYILFFALFCLRYSTGKLDHHIFAWAVCSIPLVFIRDSKSAKTMILISTNLFFAFYITAGLNKIHTLFSLALNGENIFEVAINYFRAQLSVKASEFLSLPSLAVNVAESDTLGLLGFISILVIQLGSIIPILNTKFIRLWGMLIILFHVAGYLLLNLSFLPTCLFAAVLISSPLLDD